MSTPAAKTNVRRAGRHFLQIPGPTNVPDRILRAIDNVTLDHRGPDFGRLAREVLDNLKFVFKTRAPVLMWPASGTGAWEAALCNTLSPGDRVVMFETGQFALLWREMAMRLNLDLDFIPGDWRSGADPAVLESKLSADREHRIRAICVVHNETSTGVATSIPALRSAIDKAKHPALFMVDAISSLGSMDYRHDEWGVDVTIAGSQKGLMLPPGLSFNAISDKALAATKTAKLPRAYWEWAPMIASIASGAFPYTPAINMLYGLREAIAMMREEGLDAVFARHARFGEATRRAVKAWGLELQCANPAEYSNALTTVRVPDGYDADELRRLILDHFDMSLGAGLGKVAKKVFRIGHLGDLNDLTLMGTLSGVEMGLRVAKIPHKPGGVAAALEYLADRAKAA
jgi:alanine-glyoxylate transaminase / serine-glyoxylate transaminase / serine-pyruvate transaminase